MTLHRERIERRKSSDLGARKSVLSRLSHLSRCNDVWCYLHDTTFPTRAIMGTGPIWRLSLELARLSPST